MSDLRKAAESLIPILDKWKMTYPPCSGADWDKVEALRQALAKPDEVLAEREACASLCSVVAAGRDAEAIEEAIRARGEK